MTTWRGLVRTLASVARQQELARRRQLAANEAERVAAEVELANHEFELITSPQKEAAVNRDWTELRERFALITVAGASENLARAQAAIAAYHPTLIDRASGRAKVAMASLEQAETIAQQQVEQAPFAEQVVRLATYVLARKPEAYRPAWEAANPLADLKIVGVSAELRQMDSDTVQILALVKDESVVPQEMLSQTKTGKRSAKSVSAAKRSTFYAHHICGVSLRTAREAFALLPIQTACVDVCAPLLDGANGRHVTETVCSVVYHRDWFEGVNFEKVDPVQAVRSCLHHMVFTQSGGFKPVQVVRPHPATTPPPLPR